MPVGVRRQAVRQPLQWRGEPGAGSKRQKNEGEVFTSPPGLKIKVRCYMDAGVRKPLWSSQ